MSTKPEALPIVAWADQIKTAMHSSLMPNKVEAKMGELLDQMATDHAQATAQLAALQAEVERLRPLADRYEFVRSVSYPGERPRPDEMPLSYYPIRLRVETPVYHPGTWWSYVDAAIDAALLARKGE